MNYQNVTPQQVPQQANKLDTVSYSKAVLILVAILIALGGSGYILGKLVFWKNYDTTPKLDKMEAIYSERVKGDPNNPGNYIQLGYVYFQKGDNEAAIANYKKALALDEKNYQARYNLGLVYAATDKKDRAVQEFEKAIEIAPKAASAHLGLGMVYKSQNVFDKALQELEIAWKANPGDSEVLYNIGEVNEKLGKIDDAIKAYQDTVNVLPSHKAAKEALERLLAQKK